MKNNIYFFAGILSIIVIQTTRFDFWSIYKVKPDLLLLTTCLVGLSRGSAYGVTFGFFLGLIQDAFSNGLFGAQSFSKALWGYAGGQSVLKLDPRYPMVQLLLIFAFSLGDSLLLYMLHGIFIGSAYISNNRVLLFRMMGQIVYNIALWPFIYALGIKSFVNYKKSER